MARSTARSAALMLVAGLLAAGAVQAQGPAPSQAKRKALYVGGFHPESCRYPREQRRNRVSGCCIMDLDIGADGRVLASSGMCTDPAFLEPTRLCMTAQ